MEYKKPLDSSWFIFTRVRWIPGLRCIALGLSIAISTLSSFGAAAASRPIPSLTLEEIAGAKTVGQVTALLKSRGLAYYKESNEVMKARATPEYNQSVRFVAAGRIATTFYSEKNAAAFLVSFYYDQNGDIMGRDIVIENVNVP